MASSISSGRILTRCGQSPPLMRAATEVVGVLAATSAGAEAVDEAFAALAAVDAAAQVVAANLGTLTSPALLIEQTLDGPPADEVIAKLAAILDIDVAELFKLAGRDVGGASFESQVLSEL